MEARVRKQSFCREDPEACELQILLLLQAKRLPLNVRIVIVGHTPRSLSCKSRKVASSVALHSRVEDGMGSRGPDSPISVHMLLKAVLSGTRGARGSLLCARPAELPPRLALITTVVVY